MFSTCLFFTFNFLTKNKYITKSESSPSSIGHSRNCPTQEGNHQTCILSDASEIEVVVCPTRVYYMSEQTLTLPDVVDFLRTIGKCLSNAVPLRGYKCEWYSVLTTTVVKTFRTKLLRQKERERELMSDPNLNSSDILSNGSAKQILRSVFVITRG